MFRNFFSKLFTGGQGVYADYASLTPVDPVVIRAMKPYLSRLFFNPSAVYMAGARNKAIVNEVRSDIARVLKVRGSDIYFTASGTESNNILVQGVFEHARRSGIDSPHIITSVIEHPAILEVCREIERRGGVVTYLPVTDEGVVVARDVIEAITDSTVLISLMYVNNEIGSVMPLVDVGRLLKKYKAEREKKFSDMPFFHTDASQAGYMNVDCERLGVHAMTLDGSKLYGPRGVGVLYKHRAVDCVPIMFGGGHESGLRPGTENVAGIVGVGRALSYALELREHESARLQTLKDHFLHTLQHTLPQAIINTPQNSSPHIVNICIPNLNSEYAVIQLDARSIQCASMTACKNLDDESASYVISALDKDDCATSSLRFSFGRSTKKSDINYIIRQLHDVCREQNIL